ncbi:putative diguanylate cyclase YdaM [Poriferisphaera corsica]|uniref:diguanylate cyclase n=1 Tax=Poriferisphaera corsica TaxID=2528020 RepID=A0A517YZE0_9BACT|nr:diguanylate cyclase [Poriferisphaera corsica]QDU35608.1 putative diguanylate cyclase YdaM [Poriferisphaera corsica]
MTTPSPPPTPSSDPSPADATPPDSFRFDEDLCHVNRSAPKVWNDASLRNKVTLIIIVSATAGAGIGILEMKFGHLTWPLFLALAFVISGLIAFARTWVVSPADQLITNILDICTNTSPRTIKRLPTERRDEIGQIARITQRLAVSAVKDAQEIAHLRRTLTQRIEHATRRACSQLENLASRDPLTELGNRRALDEQLDALYAAAKATRTDLLAVMIDMDNFKQINDLLGHDAGDELLVLLANILRGSIRHDDLPVRLGGDEFLILLPGCPLYRAQQLADNTRKLFVRQAKMSFSDSKLRATPNLSIGIASMNHDKAEHGDALLKIADGRLYKSKHSGKGVTTMPTNTQPHMTDDQVSNSKRFGNDDQENNRRVG